MTVNESDAALNTFGLWEADITLQPDQITEVQITATDNYPEGNHNTQLRYIYYDATAPVITLDQELSQDPAAPTSIEIFSEETTLKYSVTGRVTDTCGVKALTLNDSNIAFDNTGAWSCELTLELDIPQEIVLTATDLAGNETELTFHVCLTKVVGFNITNQLTNITSDNDSTFQKENSSYTATLTPAEHCEISSVSVVMGGEDITDTAYADGAISIDAVTADVVITAEATAIQYSVTATLTGLTSDNSAETVQAGTAYIANLNAEDGYEISSVTVTMGGEDITATAYIDGMISIDVVTGDIVITAMAQEQATV